MIPQDATFWNRSAGIYDGFMRKDLPAFRDIIALIAPRLRAESSVLEVATGTGILALGLASAHARIDAIDFAPGMIAAAKKKALRLGIDTVRFSVEDARQLPFPPESYDVVIIANALHIMPEPEKVLGEIRRVLKEKGILIAPTFVHAQNRKAAVLSRIMGVVGFHAYHRWTQRTFHQFLGENGFAVCESELIRASFPMDYAVAVKAEEGASLSVVSETLYIPLMGRIQISRTHPEVFCDQAALSVFDRLPPEVRNMKGQTEYAAMASAARSVNMDERIRAFLHQNPTGTIVNVGCGLETLHQRNDNGKALWFELDLPEVLALRNSFFPPEERDRYLPCSMFDYRWLDTVRGASQGPVMVVASGLFHYCTEGQVTDFARHLALLPEAELLFDAVSPLGLAIARFMLKRMDRREARMDFSVRNARGFAKRISNGTELLACRAFYRCIRRRGSLCAATVANMRASDLLRTLKIIHLKIEPAACRNAERE